MNGRRRHLDLGLITAVGLGLASACSDTTPREDVSVTSAAVGNGTFTGPGGFAFVPAVFTTGAVTPKGTVAPATCSGILVSPNMVLTANHCITGDFFVTGGADYAGTSLFNQTITVSFSDDVNASCATSGACFTHTSAISGPVIVQMTHAVNTASSDDVDNDLALVRLDTPVAPGFGVAPIAGLKADTPPCPDKFDGTLVGFGPTFGNPSIPPAGGFQVTNRNSSFSSGWSRSDDSPGHSSYGNTWGPLTTPLGPNLLFDGYQGVEPGDSGGPLLFGPKICGVNSKFGPDFTLILLGIVNLGTTEAAVDSAANRTFLRNNLLVGGDASPPGSERIIGLCADDTDPRTRAFGPVVGGPTSVPPVLACGPGPVVITMPFPSATDACTPAEITITGQVNTIDGAPAVAPIPLDANGQASVEPGHDYGILWTAVDGFGRQGFSGASVDVILQRPVLTLSGVSQVQSCAQGPDPVIPPPAAVSACSPVTVTGAITSVNGQTLATPIPVAADGSVHAPPGAVQVTWTGTDSFGIATVAVQTVEVLDPGPCFAAPGEWSSSRAVLLPGTQPGGGAGLALQVSTPERSNELTSANFSTTGLIIGNNLAFDLYVSPNQPNPHWLGSVAACIEIPSAGVHNRWQTRIKLNDLPLSQFTTVEFPLSDAAAAALRESHDDISVTIDLNVTAGSGPYYMQNLRFTP